MTTGGHGRVTVNIQDQQIFTISGMAVQTSGETPTVILTEEAAVALCLELAYHIKVMRDRRNAIMQRVANGLREEMGLPPLDPPDSVTGFQRR